MNIYKKSSNFLCVIFVQCRFLKWLPLIDILLSSFAKIHCMYGSCFTKSILNKTYLHKFKIVAAFQGYIQVKTKKTAYYISNFHQRSS